MIYFSYKQLPELADVPEQHRRTVWINFVLSRERSQPWISRLLGWLVIVCMIAGIAIGMFAVSAPSTITVLTGMIAGIFAPFLPYRFLNLYSCRTALRAYLSSPLFSLKPMSERAAILIYYGRPPKNA
jgi:hypothetical protein